MLKKHSIKYMQKHTELKKKKVEWLNKRNYSDCGHTLLLLE